MESEVLGPTFQVDLVFALKGIFVILAMFISFSIVSKC